MSILLRKFKTMASSLKVAVIGAGVSGLVAARELQREGLRAVVFEKADHLGGTWAYDPRIEADLLGLDPNREIIHGSLYRSLRTNIPRQLMGFSDFLLEGREYVDPRAFPGHEEVLKFLEDFAKEFRLTKLIQFNTEVMRVELLDSMMNEFLVESRTNGLSSKQVFDAVVVCNGRSTEPRIAADIPGIKKWSRKQVHSHNYREPEPFRDQIVVLIGSGSSAFDISREIATVAKEVHLSSRSPNVEVSKFDGHDNMWQHSKIDYVCEDGMVVFQDGFSVEADVIFHCTGYKYNFPFLKTNGIVTVEDNRVGPLYKHIFSPQLAPRLSFIGLPHNSGIVFRIIELQSTWIAQALSGKVLLPSKEEMFADVQAFYQQMEEKGLPKHYTHNLSLQFELLDWIAAQVGSPVIEESRKEISRHLMRNHISRQDGFRDRFDVENFLREYEAQLTHN